MLKRIRKTMTLLIALCIFASACTGLAHGADKYDLYPITGNNLLAGKTVFIDAGHGKGNGNGAAGYMEHEGNLTQALLLKANLERCGATVIMTRPTEKDVDSYARMSIVNKYALERIRDKYYDDLDNTDSTSKRKSIRETIDDLTRLINILQRIIDDPDQSKDYYTYRNGTISNTLKQVFEYENCDIVRDNMLFISIHANAYGDSAYGSVSGTETYYMGNSTTTYYKNYSFVADSRSFAGYLLDEILASGDFKDRGVKTENFFMIRELNIPAALAEVAFFTNASDRAKLMDEYYQKRIAAGMTYAVMKHFDAYVDPFKIDEPVYRKGDVNKDGEITNIDLLIVAGYVVKLSDSIDLKYADMDDDGEVTNTDVIRIARAIVHLED